MIKKQIPFNAKLAKMAWKEKPEDLVYYRLYTHSGEPVYIRDKSRGEGGALFGKMIKNFDCKEPVFDIWTIDGYYFCKETPSKLDLELYVVFDYD